MKFTYLDYSGKHLLKRAGTVLVFTFLAHLVSLQTTCAAGAASLRVGDAAPSGTLRDLKGYKVVFPGQYRDKVLILHFWAVGCSSCKEEMSVLESLSKAYSRKGLVILAVNVSQQLKTVDKFITSLGISYGVLLDIDGMVARKYEVVGLPRTFILDRKGTIHYKIVGEANEAFLRKRIQSML